MRLELGVGDEVVLVLSRRDLLSLLAKLDGRPPGSACTLVGGAQAVGIAVRAEEDLLHFSKSEPGSWRSSREQSSKN